jgi:hypothetical protein
MTHALAKYFSLIFIMTALSSCAAVNFVTDCCKAHFINDSSYEVTIVANVPGKESKTIVLAPGKKKMVSYDNQVGTWNYTPQETVTYTERSEEWWDYNFGMNRADHYYRFSDS